jgi:cyclic pyranopterin phosphate synthase
VTVTIAAPFSPSLRAQKSAGFSLRDNSTARRTMKLQLFGRAVDVYANANFSIYSAQTCNARCPFCVEELRPLSLGRELAAQKRVESDDDRYFERLAAALDQVAPLAPTISITGGEASKDPRLPRLLHLLSARDAKKLTLTTNGSGLLDVRDGAPLVEHIAQSALRHLNISRAHPDCEKNAQLMGYREGLSLDDTRRALRSIGRARPRLSCVLLRRGVGDLDGVIDYLRFAERVGVDNVIFRQLMKSDPATHQTGPVVRFSDSERVQLQPILDALSNHPDFTFQRQIVGYYYYVEVWRWNGIDVVFEEADLAQLERTKLVDRTVHELVFHPDATLSSTWQPSSEYA